jgi:DNA-binding FrmR family transcriptional regulator
VKAALRKAEEEILKTHPGHCVAHAIRSGNEKDARRKFAELVELFGKTAR